MRTAQHARYDWPRLHFDLASNIVNPNLMTKTEELKTSPAKAQPQVDREACLDAVTHAEKAEIRARRKEFGTEGNKDGDFLGLAISGGGIRSATFSLGIIQMLAKFGILKHLDYISTVSGGGYIGAWLYSWIRREQALERPRPNSAPRKEPKKAFDEINSSLRPQESSK